MAYFIGDLIIKGDHSKNLFVFFFNLGKSDLTEVKCRILGRLALTRRAAET